MKQIWNSVLKSDDYIFSLLISTLLICLVPTLLIKLIIYVIDLKYKIRIKFQLFRLHQLAAIEIYKLQCNQLETNKLFEIYIDRLWLSSRYLNRQLNNRIILCLNNVTINYYNQPDNTKTKSTLIQLVLYFYFKYIGSLSIESLNIKQLNDKYKLNISLNKFKIESTDQRSIKIKYSNSNLKFIHKQIELNFQLNIKRTDLAIELNNLFKSNLIQTIEINLENVNCLVNSDNKLVNLDQPYSENYYLINYLNNIDLKSKSNGFLDKLKLVSIRCFQCKVLNNQFSDKNKKIKLDELRLINSSEKCILVKNLTYSTETRNRNKFNLLTKLIIGLTEFKDLTIECEQLNPYLHFKFIKDLIDSKILKTLITNSKARTTTTEIKSFSLKTLNSYIHLNDDSTLIYSFGANRLNLIKNSDELKIDIKQPIIFKSTLFNIQRKSLLNNLFEMMNVNTNCMSSKNKHYWGSLLRLDRFQFKKINSLANFTIGSIAIEYSIDNLNLLDYFINFYKQITQLDILTKSTNSSQIKLSIKSIDFYLLYKNKYLIDFNLNNINYKHLNRGFNLTADSFTGVKYILNDINKIQTNETIQPIIYCFIEEKSKISSLIFLIEEIHLNKSLNSYYLTMKSVQCTWSLETHYILNESLLKPFKNKTTDIKSDKLIEFKLLVESDILINLELNFAHDSSKTEALNLFYMPHDWNTHKSSTIHTVSMILNDTYLHITNQSDFKINFKELSMFINTSHPSEFFTDQELSTSDSILKQRLQNDCNKRQFISMKQFEIRLLKQSNLLAYERLLLNTETKTNKLTLVKIDYFNLNFIFNYDFAKLIDHLLNIRKCLLKIHNITLKRTEPEHLSTDLMINIKKFQLTIEDDPFEIKLAYNYALMNDEHTESVKRRETLEQRRIIKEQNWEKEALEILNERESFIYMQRSNIIYGRNQKFKSQQQQQRAIRTELFCFVIDNFQLYSLADAEWHSRQQCYNILRKIDKHSPLSQSMSQSSSPSDLYQILWCRFVSLNYDELKFLFRDYTHPLLKLNKTNIFGHLVGAELEPAQRAKRDVHIKIFDDNLDEDLMDDNVQYSIERSMSPIKFYHDLCSKMNLFQIAYGPCWEGTMAQFNLALDKIIHPARDPSRPMPWWDKSRLYLHGNFTAHAQQLQIIYHVSMDPYNRTEEMKWVWTQLYFDWTNMQLIFKGDLDIYLNTESKYDDCRFLHLPNLEMKLKIDWICKNNSNANLHNNVMPCAPNKLPIIINSSEHDSYAQFRSENLNISLSFICNLSADMQSNVPLCKFYASTSRFIQRIKNLLSTITRPIRRGRLFHNLKMRKPILSRHFKIINIDFDIPKLNIIYWSSASEEYGMLLECEHFKLNAAHKLELVPFIDNLKRRPKPCWSVELMKCKLAQTSIFLMGPLNKTSNQQTPNNNSMKFLESERVTRSFFMQIDSIFYEREKNFNLEEEQPVLTLKKKIYSYSFKSPKNTDYQTNKGKNKSGSFKISSNGKKSTSPNISTIKRDESTLKNVSINSLIPFKVKNMPKHNIQVRNLKAKWNNINRDVIYILYEIYNKSKRLRHNISSQALKEYDLLTDQIVQSFAVNSSHANLSRKSSISSKHPISTASIGLPMDNPNTKTFFEELLNKLDAERVINSEIYCDEKKFVESSNYNDLLYGVHAANKMADVINENIFIEFINSQVKLSLESDILSESKTNKTKQKTKPLDSPLDYSDDNYLIISAAKANVVQRLHKPVWKSQRLLDKTSWNGYLEGMQYFATLDTCSDDKPVNAKQLQQFNSEYWLPDDLIDSNEQVPISRLNDNISNSSSGSAPIIITQPRTNLGMLITYNNQQTTQSINNVQKPKQDDIKEKRPRFGFGKSNRKLTKPDLNQQEIPPAQTSSNRNLQLIVSKCRCEFYMIDYDDKIPNADEYNNTSTNHNNSFNYSPLYQKLESQASTDENSSNTLNHQIDLNASFNEPIDCFSLIHYDLNLCTNSKQYKMIMNLVNNLVLYFRPHRKQLIDKQKSIKFNLQLSMGDLDSLKSHIQLKQIEAKELLCKIRAMERKLYHLRERIQNEVQFYQEQQLNDQSIANQLFIIQELNNENLNMEKDYKDNKNRLNELSDELNISISCYKEIILEKRAYTLANTTINLNSQNCHNQSVFVSNSQNYLNKLNNLKLNEGQIKLEQAQQSILNNEIGKRYEIWFKRTQWNLNEDDGQTNCAQFLMKNFLYTKVTNQQELDCVEHTLEIESCKLKDLSEIKRNDNKSNKNLDNFVLTGLFDESLSEYSEDNPDSDDFDDLDKSDLNEIVSKSSTLSSAANNNSTMIRVYCKERPPIGIPVFEHVELNVSPLSINLTNNFFKLMMNFFFNNPTPAPSLNQNDFKTVNLNRSENLLNRGNNYRHSYQNQFSVQDDQRNLMHLNLVTTHNSVLSPSVSPLSIESLNHPTTFNPISPSTSSILSQNVQSPTVATKQVKNTINKKPSQSSLFNNNIGLLGQFDQTQNLQTQSNTNQNTQLQNDDIEIMKQRSANNNTFLCIKIPEIQLLVSYRATNKDKNIKDLKNVSLLFPLFEIHDKTWTYVDLINALKSHVKKALVSQAIKHKLIKVPIQPVNKLINRTRRSNSQQHLTNLEIDEHEKMTILKLFGTKFIEKKSNNQSVLLNSNLVPNQLDTDLLQQYKLLNSMTLNQDEIVVDNTKQFDVDLKQTQHKIKKPLTKSNSLLYFKKHFFKFNSKDNTNSEVMSSTSSVANADALVSSSTLSPSLDEITK